MSKLKKWFVVSMANKYIGTGVAWAVGASASAIVTWLAEGPEWIGKLIEAVLKAASEGSITEVNELTLAVILTPIFTAVAQEILNRIQGKAIEEVQVANGEKPDRYLGEKTKESATK